MTEFDPAGGGTTKSGLHYWLLDAARILRETGITMQAEKVETAARLLVGIGVGDAETEEDLEGIIQMSLDKSDLEIRMFCSYLCAHVAQLRKISSEDLFEKWRAFMLEVTSES